MSAIGIDHGTSKCGIAVEVAGIALPQSIVPTDRVLSEIGSLVASRDVDTIIVGLAEHIGGGASRQSDIQQVFAKELRKRFPAQKIVLWDESLTSSEANLSFEELGIREDTARDDTAACLLLQHYIDSHR